MSSLRVAARSVPHGEERHDTRHGLRGGEREVECFVVVQRPSAEEERSGLRADDAAVAMQRYRLFLSADSCIFSPPRSMS
jgi:hypothetical protein